MVVEEMTGFSLQVSSSGVNDPKHLLMKKITSKSNLLFINIYKKNCETIILSCLNTANHRKLEFINLKKKKKSEIYQSDYEFDA